MGARFQLHLQCLVPIAPHLLGDGVGELLEREQEGTSRCVLEEAVDGRLTCQPLDTRLGESALGASGLCVVVAAEHSQKRAIRRSSSWFLCPARQPTSPLSFPRSSSSSHSSWFPCLSAPLPLPSLLLLLIIFLILLFPLESCTSTRKPKARAYNGLCLCLGFLPEVWFFGFFGFFYGFALFFSPWGLVRLVFWFFICVCLLLCGCRMVLDQNHNHKHIHESYHWTSS